MTTALLSVGAITWTTLGLLAAVLIVVPAPTASTWFLGVMVEGHSLALTAWGLVGLGWAAIARLAGAGALSLVALVFAGATVALSLVPVWRGLRAASTQRVRLSLRGYFSPPTGVRSASPQSVTFAHPDDTPGGLQLDVWRPTTADVTGRAPKRAAVVMVHGGGWVSGDRGGEPRWSEWLTDRGYVVFDIDYRLAPPARWRDAHRDVAGAVAWVREHASEYDVDPGRIALLGFSAGGHLALLAAYSTEEREVAIGGALNADRVAAVAALYPITDLSAPFARPHPRWPASVSDSQTELFLGGTVQANPDAARLASPVSHVAAGVPPTLVVHGRRDQMVPVEQSRLLDDRLQAAGLDHDYVELPGANHAFDLVWGAWTTQITRAVLQEFLHRHLADPI